MSRHERRVELDTCSCCGGEIPEEGSARWRASEGTCPGSLATDEHGETTGVCGAFDPSLAAWREAR